MWSKSKLIICIIAAAFFLGFLPSLIDLFQAGGSFAEIFAEIRVLINRYFFQLVAIYALVVAFVLFLEGQNPDRTLLWLIALVFLPVIGVVIYMIIGPDPSAYKRKREYKKPREEFIRSCDKETCAGSSYTAKLLYSVAEAPVLRKNRVKPLIDGDETFPELLRALRGAEKYINLQYFIINNDEIGREVQQILIDAAKRGVKVRVLYDAIGSWSLDKKYTDTLEDAGIECYSFSPVSFARFRRKMNYRNHRKIVVVDGRVAFTGGLNVGDEYLGKGPLGYWRDTHVKVEGEAVDALNRIFIDDWCFRTDEDKKVLYRELRGLEETHDFSDLPDTPLQVVSSGIFTPWHTISMGYCNIINRAEKRVWMATPYFVPGKTIIDALISSAMSGIDVRLIVPREKDHFVVHWATRSQFERLLLAGVRVFFYEKGFLHSKTILSDDTVSSIGTCNMDVRSLEINFENQIFFYDRELNKKAAEQFEKDMKECTEFRAEEWLKRPIHHKILEAFGKLYSAQI